MGNTAEKVEAATILKENSPTEKKKLKACCACPETKRARDTCVIEKGEEHCGSFIEAHKKCMRDMGFNI